VSDPNMRISTTPEYMSSMRYAHPMFTIDDGSEIISLIGTPINPNPTIHLFRNRVYTFTINSPGHPVIITTSPGASAQPVENFVSNQSIESGKIIIKTDDHPIHGPIPEHLYYQSANDPKISGKISITEVTGIPHYSTQFDGITSYELDINSGSYDNMSRYGWGLSFPVDGNVWQYYTVNEYISDGNKEQIYINNAIDWSAGADSTQFKQTPYGRTTVSYNTSAFGDWVDDGGVMDIMFEKTLREGLQLFDGTDSINTFISDSDD
jgi:hypothetical protein